MGQREYVLYVLKHAHVVHTSNTGQKRVVMAKARNYIQYSNREYAHFAAE